ncbi:ketoacyl-synthetase C-terminal extension domain-containing protein [Streptomyces sp. MS1.AVA.1]|uniref:Ketoacyl-synthetase C-terminal extension domain-containing protein n=1 Tax=Streptomyces machairae TaxID=3134109 RepID=A0ABU8UV65_9ACTN
MANFSEPNPALDLDHSPFYIPGTARPWPESDVPRRAGLTSLGVGGTNVHLILEQAPNPLPGPTPPHPRTCCWSPRAARPPSRTTPAPSVTGYGSSRAPPGGPGHHRRPRPRPRPPPARSPWHHPDRSRRRP